MKILFITQFLPYPADTGGKIKTWKVLRVLAKKHQVFLISFVEEKEDLRWELQIKKVCFALKTFVTPIITTSYQKLKQKALLGILNPKPFRVQKYFLKETADFIERLTKKEKFDVIWCDHETSFQYLTYVYEWQKKLKIYDEHNISSEGLFQYVKYEKNLITKFAYFLEGLKFYFYENFWIIRFGKVLTISKRDRKILIKKGIEKKKVNFLPIPFERKSIFKFGSKNIFFIGLLSWWPNHDAMMWFYKKIFPKIKKKILGVKFFVVGVNPSPEIQKIGRQDQSVVVAGHVKDVLPYFKKAGVFVAPIRAGAGVRVKILEALSLGLPIVSTRMAAMGIKLEDQKNIFLVDTEEEFVKRVVEILSDEKLASKLSQNGAFFIRENYNREEAERVLTWAFSGKGK